jgi:hypothetical protein
LLIQCTRRNCGEPEQINFGTRAKGTRSGAIDIEEGHKKRKNDSINQAIKRQKLEERTGSKFFVGDQVAAKVGTEWILAMLVDVEKEGHLEIEVFYSFIKDIEEDEEKPGTKKKYRIASDLCIPIKQPIRKEEFPVNHEVLALYPASSCFYRATVVVSTI